MKFRTVKDDGHTYKFYLIVVLFDKAFKKLWSYVETNTEPLCIEFCNCAQYPVFLNYLT
jgi:hypothetical protein